MKYRRALAPPAWRALTQAAESLSVGRRTLADAAVRPSAIARILQNEYICYSRMANLL
jgi:hypothetical protein